MFFATIDSRCTIAAFVLAVGWVAAADSQSHSTTLVAAQEVGLVREQPAKGRFVKTDSGFMVPYTTTIPGSKVSITMVPIPGGQFKMGSPESEPGHQKCEGPRVLVELAPFWMSAYEVTWAEYHQYMALHDVFREFESRGIRTVTDDREIDAITAPSILYDPETTYQSGEDPRQPAVMMTQYAAKQYSKWLSAVTGQFHRLPSEAEWEYACRAGNFGVYHFGDDASLLNDHAWYDDNSEDRSHKVGQKKPNLWGLYDMHGNVAEWVLDRYTENGYAAIENAAGAVQNVIQWPTATFPLAIRGGSFEMNAAQCRSASRLGSDDEEWKDEDPNLPASPWWYTSTPATGIGFRVVRPLQVPDSPQDRERYWNSAIREIAEDVQFRIYEQESGAKGIVDKDLPAAIKALKK